MSNLVPVAPLREAFERSGRDAKEIAAILGMKGGTGHVDGAQFLKSIGARSYSPGHSRPSKKMQRCSYDKALKIAEAIGVDPVDVGL